AGLWRISLDSLPAAPESVLATANPQESKLALAFLADSNLPPPATALPPTATRRPATPTPPAVVKNLLCTTALDAIRAIQTDGAFSRTLSVPGGNPAGIAYDPVGNHLYWASVGAGVVRRANPDGSGQQNVVFGAGMREVVIDSAARVLYYRTDGSN